MKEFNMLDLWTLEGAITLDDWSDTRKEAIRRVVNRLKPEWMKEILPPKPYNYNREVFEDKIK